MFIYIVNCWDIISQKWIWVKIWDAIEHVVCRWNCGESCVCCFVNVCFYEKNAELLNWYKIWMLAIFVTNCKYRIDKMMGKQVIIFIIILPMISTADDEEASHVK